MKEITLQAKTESIPYVTHVRVSVNPKGILLRWGYFHNYRFSCTKTELLNFYLYPELYALHDNNGWDMIELINLVGVTPQENVEGLQVEFITN